MENRTWSVEELLQLSGSYWSVCALHSGVKLDIFTLLTESPQKAQELAARVKADVRGVTMLLDALAAMGLLVKDSGTYSVTPFASNFLSRSSSGYLGHIILHHHHLMPAWSRLDEAVLTGHPVRTSSSRENEESARESFLMGMFNLAMQIAPRISSVVDLSGCRRLLDLGGGPGTYAIHFCLKNPGLEAVVYDLPTTRPFAEDTIAKFGLSSRIRFVAGDYFLDELPGGFDAVWLSHILHSEPPTGCAALIQKGVAALNPGGHIFIQEFLLDSQRDAPLFPALFSLNMLIGTSGGQSYSEQELQDMLGAVGAESLTRLPIELPNGAGILAGTVRQGSAANSGEETVKLENFCGDLKQKLSETAPGQRLETIATEVAGFFKIRNHEVALFSVDRSRNSILFRWPHSLASIGNIPLKAVNSVVATTANDKRSILDNNFAKTRHLYMFEHFLANRDERIPVQKMMSVPMIVNGNATGVIQVVRKGATPDEAGADFTSSDLADLERIAVVIPGYMNMEERQPV